MPFGKSLAEHPRRSAARRLDNGQQRDRRATDPSLSTSFHLLPAESGRDGPDGIACWFIDTDYNEESFFARHA